MGDLTTVANAKAWAKVTGTADDAMLARLVSAVSAAVQQFIDRQILTSPYTETRHGADTTRLVLRNGPVTAVSSVTIDNQAIPARSQPGAAGFTFDDLGLFLEGYTFNRGVQNVVVVYTAGYATVPLDLEQAVLDIVAQQYKARDWIGQSSQVLAGQTVNFLRDVPVATMRAIKQYQRPMVGP